MTKILKYLSIFLIFFVSGCVKDPPGFAEYNVGVGLFQAGDYEGAIAHFQKAVAENPSFAEAYMNLGTGLYRMEQYTEAMAAYEKADSLFRSGEYIDVRGAQNEQKLNALHEMMDITGAQIRLLDSDNLTEAEVEELRNKVAPLKD
jgi:tetratricopeptide (TPR) repeat protein